MSVSTVPETQFTEAKAHLSEVMDDVVHGNHLRAIRRKKGEVAFLVTPEMLGAFVPAQYFSVDYLPEEDGTISLWLNGLEVGAHGATVAEARAKLVGETIAFVAHYLRNFDRLRHFTNMIAIAPQIAKIAVAPDADAVAKMLFAE